MCRISANALLADTLNEARLPKVSSQRLNASSSLLASKDSNSRGHARAKMMIIPARDASVSVSTRVGQ
jgi:hypothetical protein